MTFLKNSVKTRQAVRFVHVTRMERTRLQKIAMNQVISLNNKPVRGGQKWIDKVLKELTISRSHAMAISSNLTQLTRL